MLTVDKQLLSHYGTKPLHSFACSLHNKKYEVYQVCGAVVKTERIKSFGFLGKWKKQQAK